MYPTQFMNADFAVSAITVCDVRTNWSVSGGLAVNGNANGTDALLGSTTNSTAQIVHGTFTIQDGAGLFVSSGGATSGVFFTIEYYGANTLFKLKVKDPSVNALSDNTFITFAEIPMPKNMSRGSEYKFTLTVGMYGWAVGYITSGGAEIGLLQLPYTGLNNPSTLPPSGFSDFLRSATSLKAGFYATKNGVTCRLLKVYHIGYQHNPTLGVRVVFGDTFSGAASAYNPATADIVPTGVYFLSPVTVPIASGITKDGAGNCSITSLTAIEIIGQPVVSLTPWTQDAPCTMISFKYVSGSPVVGATMAVNKNVFVNSSISGVASAITVETGGV